MERQEKKAEGCNEAFRYLHLGLPEQIRRKADFGDLDGARQAIEQMLQQPHLPWEMRQCLRAQEEMLLRLPSDFPYTKQEALALVREQIADFTEQEFDALERAHRIRWIYVSGEKRYFDRFFETLCKGEPALARRAGCDAAPRNEAHLKEAIAAMQRDGMIRKRFHCRASVRLPEGAVRPGQQVLACLPVPCACEAQSDICIETLQPASAHLSPEHAPQRAVFWQEAMQENHSFTVAFSYVRTAVYRDLWSVQSASCTEAAAHQQAQGETLSDNLKNDLKNYLKEEPPHLMYTPYIRALAKELTQQLAEPLEKARAIYDFVTKQVAYTFMPAYFSLEAIADNCAKSLTGDCGVQTLLFLALCRCVGIPARWESGWAAEPGFCGAHDWAQFYVAPFGWLYADVSYGGDAAARQDELRRRFYFGNIDPYRMTANTAFQAAFDVQKAGWRADPYDNQVGEMELDGRGLRYSEFLRTKEVLAIEDLPLPADIAERKIEFMEKLYGK